MTKSKTSASRSGDAAPKAETRAEARVEVRAEDPAPFVLTEAVDGIGPRGRVIWRTPTAAADLPVRKARPADIALAAG